MYVAARNFVDRAVAPLAQNLTTALGADQLAVVFRVGLQPNKAGSLKPAGRPSVRLGAKRANVGELGGAGHT